MVTFSNSNYPTHNAQRSYTQFTAVHLAQSKQKRELTNQFNNQLKNEFKKQTGKRINAKLESESKSQKRVKK